MTLLDLQVHLERWGIVSLSGGLTANGVSLALYRWSKVLGRDRPDVIGRGPTLSDAAADALSQLEAGA